MSKHPKAQVVPFSSIVGSSVTLHDPETGRVFGQLAILNTGGDTHDDWKRRQMAVAEDAAKRINLHDDLVAELKSARALLSVHAEDFAKAQATADWAMADALVTEIDAVLAKVDA
jgi:hypothetical protein